MINASNEFIKAMLSPQKRLYIKLEIYDSKMQYLREITQQVRSDLGSLAINGDSPIRRSFRLTLDNSLGEFIFGENNLIWLDKRIKMFVGLQKWSGEIEYVPMGLFLLTEPEDAHSLDGKPTTINAVDKAYLMTDKRGKFINETIIQKGVRITDAIRTIATGIGETMFNFDNVTDTLPYELTYSGTDNRWNAIQELATLAKCTIFYDVYGYLTLKKVDLNKFENEPITWSYVYGDPRERLYAGNVRKLNDSNLYNDIVVLGGSSDIAVARYRLTIDEKNSLWKNHPYSIQKIGISTYFHNNGNPDPLISTSDEAKYRAKFEMMNRLGFVEDVQLALSPNYLHDADDIVFVKDLENGIEGSKYRVKSISLPLSPSIMTMEVSRYNQVISDWNSF